jgi:hypothetical protein
MGSKHILDLLRTLKGCAPQNIIIGVGVKIYLIGIANIIAAANGTEEVSYFAIVFSLFICYTIYSVAVAIDFWLRLSCFGE